MNRKLAFIILSPLLICLGGALSTYGQETEASLKDKKITIKMDKQPLGAVFKNLMENYDLLIGFEKSAFDFGSYDFKFETNLSGLGRTKFESADGNLQIDVEVRREFEAKKHWITLHADAERLEEVFNIIVGQMENYKWEINDGVINIFPIYGRDQRFEKLLETKISNFTFEKGSTVKAITTNIKRLPEFKKFLTENNLFFTGIRTGSNILLNQQYGKKIDETMNFSNLTFKELLNKITKVKRGGWIIRSLGGSRTGVGEHIDIDI